VHPLCSALWLGCRRKFLHTPFYVPSPNSIERATPLSFFAWVYFGLLFNHLLHARCPAWWRKYNYITAAGLDAGLILSTIVIFFAITLPGVEIPQWWGNVGVLGTKVSFSFLIPGSEGMVWENGGVCEKVLICFRMRRLLRIGRRWERVENRSGRRHGEVAPTE
jgi:hypothetical protein